MCKKSLNFILAQGVAGGFAQHAVRLRNDWLMQKATRPARENPDEVNFSLITNCNNVTHVGCLYPGLHQNDGIGSLKKQFNYKGNLRC